MSATSRFRSALVVASLCCVILSACGDSGQGKKNRSTPTPTLTPTATATPTSTPTPTVNQSPGLGARFSLRFENSTMLLDRGGESLLRWPLEAFQLGIVSLLEPTQNYDPYPLVAGIPVLKSPRGLHWIGATGALVASADTNRFVVELTFPEDKRATLTAALEADGRFALSVVPQSSGLPTAFFRLAPRVDTQEAFYGLGEYFDSVNQRGKIRAMQLEVDTSIESSNNEAHVPIPFVIGTRGWGLFVESPYPAAFDVAAKADDVVEVTFGTGYGSDAGLRFHLFAAEHPLDVTKHYYDVTGYPLLPARWALGPWVWRDENRDQAQVEDDLQTMRDLDLATTAIWIDRPYANGVETFDFKASQFPAPQSMIDLAHDLGFRMALWHTPYIDRTDPAVAALRQEAMTNDYFPLRTGLLLNPWGLPIDFTKPEAFDWWQGHTSRYTAMGIEGFKLDYAEDVVPGLLGTRNVWMFHDGSDESTMHNLYQLYYHRVYAELLPQSGGFLLCRAGKYGSQRYASVIWPGDLDANMAKHRETVTDCNETYVAVGGLPASLIAGLTLGPSGFPFYGSDTGGYQHSPPDKETFVRWFEQTSLSSVMQIGTSSSDVAWEPTPENGFDEETLDWYRIYTRLHLRLFPYEWTYAQRIAADGRPIQRALGLAYPEIGVHPDDTYLFGDDLLVAPVVERGQRQRQVILPPGTWFDWWTGEAYAGSQTVTVDAPLGTLPLFLRAGGIIPMLRPTIDTISPTTQPERVDSYATTPGVLYVRVVAGPESAFEVFDGAEIHQSFSNETGPTISLSDGDEFNSGFVVEVIGNNLPVSSVHDGTHSLQQQPDLASLEASASGWFVDQRGGLWIKVPGGSDHVIGIN